MLNIRVTCLLVIYFFAGCVCKAETDYELSGWEITTYDDYSAVIHFCVRNTGDANGIAPFHVALYGDTRTEENLIIADSFDITPAVGQTSCYDLAIPALTNITASTTFRLSVNDDGKAVYLTPENNYDNNLSLISNFIFANPDSAQTLVNQRVGIRIFDNDFLRGNCYNVSIDVVPPKNGMYSFSSDYYTLYYTPDFEFTGTDTLVYRIICGRNVSYAKVLINAIGLPDNVSNADCFVKHPETTFDIREMPYNTSVTGVDAYYTPVVGDVDDDGDVEIIVPVAMPNPYNVDQFLVINGRTGVVKDTIKTTHKMLFTSGSAIYKADGETYLLIPASDVNPPEDERNYLFAYKQDKATKKWQQAWKSSTTYVVRRAPSFPMIADLDADGTPEIIIGTKIYNAKTGVQLADFSTLTTAGASQRGTIWAVGIGDILQNGKQQIVLSNKIYSVAFADKNGDNPGAFTLEATAPATSYSLDRVNVLADFNNDGYLDVLYVGPKTLSSTGTSITYAIWDVQNNRFLGGDVFETANIAGGPGTYIESSMPLVGDVNGDGLPEFVFMTRNLLHCFSYDPLTDKVELYWTYTVSDGSGTTGITLFDFNSDGKSELVYRDENRLWLFDGSEKGNCKPLASFDDLHSGTGFEYPVVADINNDGQAEIVTIGTDGSSVNNGRLYVFGAEEGKVWAPARRVWNQYAYNALNVNEDLTIPKIPFNSTTLFPGEDGQPGTADDVRPFNNFLQQQTILNKNGNPLWVVPDYELLTNWELKVHADRSAVIHFCIKNNGSASGASPFQVSLYKNRWDADSLIVTESYNEVPAVGETKCYDLNVLDFKNITASSFLLSVNDRGNAAYIMPECNYANDSLQIRDIITAYPDFAETTVNKDVVVEALDNDYIPSGCRDLTLEISIQPENGNAQVNVNNLIYTPLDGFTGKDSLTYRITCGGDVSYAKVHIVVVSLPDNISPAHCFTEPPSITFNVNELARSESRVSSVTNPVCGDIDGDGEIEILVMNTINYFYSDAIHIYGFNTTTNQLYLKYTIPVAQDSYMPFSPIAIAKVDGSPYASVFYTSAMDRKLYRYDLNGTSYTQTWEAAYADNNLYRFATPTITDIMGNGRTQICLLDKVFDTKTGALLADGGFIPSGRTKSNYSFGCYGHANAVQWSTNNSFESMMVAIDTDNDGVKELIGGDCVYAVNIVNFDGIFGNTFQLKQRAKTTGGHVEIGDGGTAVADIDNDGNPEIVVAGPAANGFVTTNKGMLYVYDPRTGEVVHTNRIIDIPRDEFTYGPSRPFIGDVDGDGYPEICLTGSYVLQNYKYNITGKTLDLAWSLPTTDFSGSTTLTMFDFAQDGKARLVYRDQESLRIIDASTNPPTIEMKVDGLYSPTVNEFPIIADVNGNGAAEIILTATANENWNGGSWAGELYVYASAGKPWAPARKVWNQSAYNVLNVNEDLTIPSFQLNPATVFPGKDELLGTPDDVRPFNNFLQQQTLLNRNGNPLWVVPDYELQKGWEIEPEGSDNSATVHFCVKNIGNAHGTAPFHVSFYKNSWDVVNVIAMGTYDLVPEIGEEICYELFVPGFYNMDATKFIIFVNDEGNAAYLTPECNYINNPLDPYYEEFPLAYPDSLTACAAGTVDFDYINRNKFPDGTVFMILQNPAHGVLSDIGGGILRYTPQPPYPSTYLTDTLTYELKKGNYSSRADLLFKISPLPVVAIAGKNTIYVQDSTALSPASGGTWVSNNPEIASVSATGVVTGLSEGTATFTFTDSRTNCSATTDAVTVRPVFHAENDSSNVISCGGANVTIPILSNDPIVIYSECPNPVVTLRTAPTLPEAQAEIVDNELNYLLNDYEFQDFTVELKDSVRYEVSCDTLKSEAWAYIFIQKGDENTIKLSLNPENSLLCIYGEPLELTATISETEIPDPDITWSWPQTLSAQDNKAWYVPSHTGSESVIVTAADRITRCTGSGTFYVTVQDSSRITIEPDNQYFCQDGEQEITLTAKVETGNPSEIVWYDNDRTPVNPDKTSSKGDVFPSEPESVYWAYATDLVCGDSPRADTTVYITTKVYLILTADTTRIQMGDEITLSVTPTNDEHGAYRWYDASTGELLGETSVNTFTYVLEKKGSYAFYVLTDNNYCPEAQSNTVNVKAADYFIIPNIITPYNANSKNDTFLTPTGDRPGYKVEIYNRYQQRILKARTAGTAPIAENGRSGNLFLPYFHERRPDIERNGRSGEVLGSSVLS